MSGIRCCVQFGASDVVSNSGLQAPVFLLLLEFQRRYHKRAASAAGGNHEAAPLLGLTKELEATGTTPLLIPGSPGTLAMASTFFCSVTRRSFSPTPSRGAHHMLYVAPLDRRC